MENKTTASAHEKRASKGKGKGYKTSKKNIEQAYSEMFIERIEKAISASTDKWKNPCIFSYGQTQGPYNVTTQKDYDGVNVAMLTLTALAEGYEHGAWLTYKQAEALGEKVGKDIHVPYGAKGTQIIFWDKSTKWVPVKADEDEDEGDEDDDNDNEDTKTDEKTGVVLVKRDRWFLKVYTVFNVAQVEWDGWDYSGLLKVEEPVKYDSVALATMKSAEKFLTSKYKGGAPKVYHVATETNCYSPALDIVKLCPLECFTSPDEFFSTFAHELGHSTGAPTRLNRKIANRFGSDPYAREELVAETIALMCCAAVGLLSTYGNSVAYLKSWLRSLKNNKESIVWAFKEAQKGTDWILGIEKARK